MTSAIVCSFSAGLDDLKAWERTDPISVLRVLQRAGRFSVFEATANDAIARTMTRLCHKGYSTVTNGVRKDYGRLIETDNTCGYPWTKVKLTEGGLRLLAENTATKEPS